MTGHDRQLVTNVLKGVIGLLLLVLALVALVFLQSYHGREAVVESQRKQCLAFQRTSLVPIANALRAQEIANRRIAQLPIAPDVRRVLNRTASIQSQTLRFIDRRIDRSLLAELNPIGRQIVRGFGTRAFSCEDAYPSANPFQFFG